MRVRWASRGIWRGAYRIDIATGERKIWDENSYACSYAQRLNDLYVVEGLF